MGGKLHLTVTVVVMSSTFLFSTTLTTQKLIGVSPKTLSPRMVRFCWFSRLFAVKKAGERLYEFLFAQHRLALMLFK